MRYLFAGCLLACAAFAAVADPLPVEEFFKRPDYTKLKISPDGTRVAAIARGPKRDLLAVLELDTRKGRPITNFADADVLYFQWIDNKRLVFNVGDAHEAMANAEYYGWYVVNADGSGLDGIDRWANNASRQDARVARAVFGCFDVPLGSVKQCITDPAGVARVAYSYEQGRERISYRAAVDAPWRILEEAEEGKLSFRPLDIDADGTLYVKAYEKGRDKSSIFRYELEKSRIGERLARHLDANMDSVILSESGRLLGYSYDGERSGVVWVDEQMARLQRMVNQALPDTMNELSVAAENPKRALVAAHSESAPPTFYFFNTEKLTLEKFASSRPWLKPAELSERKFVIYQARDGLDIPAFLTLPKSSSGKNLPLVVEIHGGPWTEKQSPGFNENAQFFASRGYAVLQPDFRGTMGYSRRHYQASFGQWGLSMQDDITDGVEWLIARGIADKNRICLFGGSYGGYATLWGLMKTPDLYRCGVAYVALTDIRYYFKFNRWDWDRSVWADYGARELIGDPDRDADKFKSVSPVEQAQRLKAPVLLAYGGSDQRVPVSNGYAMRAALDRYGKSYEWVMYPDEGHGFNDDKNRFDFWRRVDAFLKKYLQTPPPASSHDGG
jgi:dipeptidyl aminopeptidase/acylaminoacyl peptidase